MRPSQSGPTLATSSARTNVPEVLDLHPAMADMERLVVEGLSRQPRQLPAWFLYDAEGSRLFDRICEQPEYGLTRCETMLLEDFAPSMAAALGRGTLVEFGAGSARKVSPLLAALSEPAYVPLDISADHLRQACSRLQTLHPQVPMVGVVCDYSDLDRLPDHPLLRHTPLQGFYPGSSLGNFEPAEARRLLRQFARLLGPEGRLLIGIDQPKQRERLEAAYNDAAGYSAAFAFNLLTRLNRDLGSNFDPDLFEYRAQWLSATSRIEMALICRKSHTVQLAQRSWEFESGSPLITEYSVKYTPEAFQSLAASAGWRPLGRWSDPNGDFSLHLLEQNLDPDDASAGKLEDDSISR